MTHHEIELAAVYLRSDDVVARAIEDEFLLVPIGAGIGDLEDALYTLNETGREIWTRLAPGKTVQQLIDEIYQEFDVERQELSGDVCGLLGELLALRMICRAA